MMISLDEDLLLLAVVSAVAAVLGLYEFILFLRKYVGRPRPVVGVVPIDELEQGTTRLESVGRVSPAHEFEFHPEIFAPPVNESRWGARSRDGSPRIVQVIARNEVCELPIVVQNLGRSNMDPYKLTVGLVAKSASEPTSTPYVRIRKICTETLTVDGLFADEAGHESPRWIGRIPDEVIRRAYARLGLDQDFVSFTGSLGSGSFELVHLKLLVPSRVDSMDAYFTVDCGQLVSGRVTYGQKLAVSHLGQAEPSSPPSSQSPGLAEAESSAREPARPAATV